eukprot:TRINITY_DN528_c0_g1_i1.p2 TRINITY_DN528_c0_g1~~TRINITY_DN528_c0_g1_i1.p2  ORF type:complete len:127 (-),score=51.81 TRINITY_DN528_c0_g1_i1:131-511(-)
MSWQAYVDNNLVGTKTVTQGAILGQEGGVWAATGGFTVQAPEIKTLVAAFKDANGVRASGFNVAGVHYITLRADERSVYGKKGAAGIVCVKTGKAVLVGVYNDKIQPGQCANTVEKLADYLIEQGY